MRSIPVWAMVLLGLTCGCSRIKSKYDEVKECVKKEINAAVRTDFYSDYGAWDFYRVPLIAPYELTAIDDRNIWKCEKRRDMTNSIITPQWQSLVSSHFNMIMAMIMCQTVAIG